MASQVAGCGMISFNDREIIQAADWPNMVAAVDAQTPSPGWIFRALESPKKPELQKKNRSVSKTVEVAVRSSFDRAWDSRSWNPEPARWRYEAWMLREFKRAAYLYRSDLPAPSDYLEWLALARHYEMPSRLVDFTYSFYVASYFAFSGKEKDQDGFILAINHKKLKQATEAKLPSWGFSPPREDWDFHNPVIFREFAFEKQSPWVVPVAPSRRNERLLNQHGLFLCPGSIEETFEDNLCEALKPGKHLKLICLHSNLREDCIPALKKMNVDMRMLYPDLTGFAQSIRDLVHLDIDGADVRFEQELKRAISAKPWC
jgi:hypothetical protein